MFTYTEEDEKRIIEKAKDPVIRRLITMVFEVGADTGLDEKVYKELEKIAEENACT